MTINFMLSSSYSLIKRLDVERLCKNYDLWGPSARTCMSLMDGGQLEDYKRSVESAADKFTRDVGQFADLDDMSVSHRLLVLLPCKTRRTVTATLASDHVLGFVFRAYAKRDLAARQRFYQMISRYYPWLCASARYIFETGVLLWFRYSPTEDLLSCDPALDWYPELKIPACRENMVFFSKPEALNHVDNLKLPFCLVSVSETSAAVVAIVLTEDFVITVQMTIASKHDAKSIGFEKIYEGLPPKFLEARTWCHVFLTDTEDKAISLREQRLDDVVEKLIETPIYFYSAFFNVDELASILTAERAEKLNDDIVSRYWQYVIDTYW
jgi:hypothetical protein